MKHINVLSFIFLFILSFSFGEASETLIEINNEPVSTKEFLYIYQKNNIDGQADFSQKSLEDYLELFINYKLKINQAKDLGLDTNKALISEYEGYKKQLLETHVQRETLDPLIKQEYKRSLSDVGMAHIFIDKDTENAERKIKEAHQALVKGELFEQVAAKYSEDDLSKSKGGFVGYFSAMQIGFPQIEDALYNTKVEAFSDVIVTERGYHIFKVLDVRPARRSIKVAIVKIDIPEETELKATAKAKIDSVYMLLQQGESFGELAMKYSDDETTKMRGGEMDWFGINTYVRDFEEAAYALEEDGQISEPFQTEKSWYVIKRLKLADVPTQENSERLIRTKLISSKMYQQKMDNFYSALKTSFGFKLHSDAVEALKEQLDTVWDSKPYQFASEQSEKPLMEISGRQVTEKEFVKVIQAGFTKSSGGIGRQKTELVFRDAVRELLLDAYEQSLIDTQFEYASLLEEYKNGVLIFELSKMEVWDKAVKDSLGLINFYKSLGNKYAWNKRAEIAEIVSSKKDLSLKEFKKTVKKQKLNSTGQWEQFLENNPDSKIKATLKTIEEGVSEESQNIVWTKGVHVNEKGGLYQVIAIRPSQRKALSEVRGLVVTEYQDSLEKNWLRKLRQTYRVEVNRDVLQKLVK